MKTNHKPQTNSLPGADDITRTQLANGITLLHRANFNSPSVVVSGYVSAGSLFDPADKLGMAYFTALAVMRGTQTHQFQEIYDALESVGASLGFNASVHSTGFNGKSLIEDLPLLLDLLKEILHEPTFSTDQVERLRAQILTGLAIRAQDTGDMASLTFDQIVYENHPYQYPEDGYPETVQAIRQSDLVDFHRTGYGPAGMVIVIVGAVEAQVAADLVAQRFGAWQNPAQGTPPQLPPLHPLAKTVTRKVAIPGKSQADIVMGASGPTRVSPDYIPASLGNSILGQFGMMGRIGGVVRERSGLAYYAYTNLNTGIGPGSWEVIAGVNPKNIKKSIDLIQKEIARFVKEPVLAEELENSQANFIGRLPLSLESNQGVAGALINLERYQLGLDYYRNYAGLIRAVTPEQILESARHYLNPGKLAIAIAGPGD